ncbi:unnamed protein product [Bursaphelenchus xylophilus]|uniref:nicotinamidase n=1 Tax=Bursaphelenchus xylophilus TaxID=6326 RepID=A0A1I7S5D6_BURXY|nr:unnamed protein product [Bursaphelenchus xylophilus]CAG9117960.1 unnamed protein product [Bursaphelenchus xylophilus]
MPLQLQENATFPVFEEYILKIVSYETPTTDKIRLLFDQFDKDQDGFLDTAEAEEFNNNVIEKINSLKSALIIVDFQNDFVHEEGTLRLKDGPAQEDPLEIVDNLNALLQRHSDFDLTIFTIDWHPKNHISFYENANEDDRIRSNPAEPVRPFSLVQFEKPKLDQVVYPAHAIQGSFGAEIHEKILKPEDAIIVEKGYDVYVDSYSGFGDNRGVSKTQLGPILRQHNIEALFLCGIASDICLAYTAIDASKLGFYTVVVEDCIKGIDPVEIQKKKDEIIALGVPYVNSEVVFEFLTQRKVPWEWLQRLAEGN